MKSIFTSPTRPGVTVVIERIAPWGKALMQLVTNRSDGTAHSITRDLTEEGDAIVRVALALAGFEEFEQ